VDVREDLSSLTGRHRLVDRLKAVIASGGLYSE
jgi:hypothetical protein